MRAELLKRGRWWICLLVFFLNCPGARAAQSIPRITATLDKNRIQTGGQATLTVEVTWEGEASELEFLPPAPPDCHLVTVVNSAQKSMAYRSEGRLCQIRRYLFRLRGEEEGEGRVGYFRLLYRRRGEEEEHSLRSEPLDIVVTSRLGKIFPAGARDLAALAAGLLVVLLIVFYIRWTVRRYKKKTSEIISEYVENLESESIRELGLARKLRVEGDIEGYFNQIWKVLSVYLGKKYSLKISDNDWESKLEEAGDSVFDAQSRTQIKEILKILESSRFGIYPQAPGAPDSILKKVISFIESQKG